MKSVGGERLREVNVDELGLQGDRRWGIRDHATGNVLTARREPRLLFASARVDDAGAVVLTMPDGTQTNDNSVLSAWLGYDVSLDAASDVGGTYENPLNVEDETDWMSWTGPAGAWHDSSKSRVSIVSTRSLGAWDVRRFRTNIVVDAADEDSFVEHSVRVGNCTLSVTNRISRCIMVTRSQPSLDRDLDVLKTVNREHAGTLSIGALVTVAGAIAVGDVVTIDG